MATLQVRGIDPLIKEKAEAVFRQLGITSSSAIKMFFNQIAVTRGIPFAPTVNETGFSEEQEKNILAAWKEEEFDEFESMKDCIDDLHSHSTKK